MSHLEKENIILKKQAELIKRQTEEVREEYQSLKEKYDDLVSRKSVQEYVELFEMDQFMDLDVDGSPILLRQAMKFYETHDGCPFHQNDCPSSGKKHCNSIWIKMGTPCSYFMHNIIRYSNTLKKI